MRALISFKFKVKRLSSPIAPIADTIAFSVSVSRPLIRMLSIFVRRGKATEATAARTQKSAKAARMRRPEGFLAFLARVKAALNLSADSVNLTDAGATRPEGKEMRPDAGATGPGSGATRPAGKAARPDAPLAGSAASLFAIPFDAAVPGIEVSLRVVECRILTE